MRLFDLNTRPHTCMLTRFIPSLPLHCRSIAIGAPANDCLAPTGKTRRVARRSRPAPQPNFGTTPTNVADIKDFTRVFLNNNPDVRCLDGTRPTIYVDKAVGGPSNKWIFTVPGGGSCNAQDSNGDGVFDNAQECLDTMPTRPNVAR